MSAFRPSAVQSGPHFEAILTLSLGKSLMTRPVSRIASQPLLGAKQRRRLAECLDFAAPWLSVAMMPSSRRGSRLYAESKCRADKVVVLYL